MRLTNLYDLKVQAHGHKVETSRFQDRHHPMKGSHVHRMQRRFLLMTGTGLPHGAKKEKGVNSADILDLFRVDFMDIWG